jgi:hypothetical protein
MIKHNVVANRKYFGRYPSECIDSLIAKPLQDHVKMFGTKRYLICVDHMDECSAKKRAKWDIIGIYLKYS